MYLPELHQFFQKAEGERGEKTPFLETEMQYLSAITNLDKKKKNNATDAFIATMNSILYVNGFCYVSDPQFIKIKLNY